MSSNGEDSELNENNTNNTNKGEDTDNEQNTNQLLSSEEDVQELFIGDRIGINTKKYGEITGRIYYFTEDLIRIMPDGASDILYDFPIINGEFDSALELIADADGNEISFYEKGPRVGFVELRGFRVGQILEAINVEGINIGAYEIININDVKDSIEIKNKETDDIKSLQFNGEGIPREEPFVILRISPEIIIQPSENNSEEEPVIDENIEEFELPDIARVETILAQERIYPEITQKSEFLADLLFMEDTKNPKTIQKLFKLVELFSSLKNSIIKRKSDGSTDGEEIISITTLLELLEKRILPISRPVLDTKRIIMTEYPDEEEKDSEQYLIRSLARYIDESREYLESMDKRPTSEIGIPRWFLTLDQYFSKYPLGDKYSNDGDYSFSDDGEYFRSFEPGSKNLKGLVKPDIIRQGEKVGANTYEGHAPEELIGPVTQSLRRGHGPTVRGMVKGGTEIVQSGDSAVVNGYVLFPYSTVTKGYLGAIRSGVLWNSILRSSSIPTSMSSIMEEYEGISNILDAQNILYLKSDTAVRIPFSEYLRLILSTTIVHGPGDLISIKYDLGLQEMELNLEQDAIMQERVREIIASFRAFITNKRKESQPIRPEITTQEFAKDIKSILQSHTFLKEKIAVLESRLSNYKDVDIAVFLFLYNISQNYFLACLSKNPKSIQHELRNYSRDYLLNLLKHNMLEQKLEKEKGAPPQPNPCEHTDILTAIRKIKDSTQRIQALSKFTLEYKGGREENWILCGGRPGVPGCGQHLICHHELLQIQQFLHPREHQAIQKEIILGYAGGTFGRNHICRNCGLPIAEMEYDTSIEYDDEGKPLMGRSELVDQEANDKEELEELFGKQIETSELVFTTNLAKEYYKIAIVICNSIGVMFDDSAYTKLVERAELFSKQFIVTEKEYVEQGKDKKGYAKYVTCTKISIAGALILVDVQSRVPDYIVRYIFDGCNTKDGCKPGFGGFPLVSDANVDKQDESIGLHYISYAISEFYPSFEEGSEQDIIWKNGFHTFKNKTQRKSTVIQFISNSLKNILEKDPNIQKDLETKRKYLEKMFGGSKGLPGEKIPSNFLPRMESSLESAANSPTVESGIKGKDEEHLANAWIRAIHGYAKDTTLVIKGNPYAETSCCTSRITEPGGFLNHQSLPELIQKSAARRSYASVLYPPFIPRELQVSSSEPSLELAYRVFLQVCWRGPRVGRAHELGYDNKCDWCDIEIPVEYLYPDVYLEDPTWKSKRIKEEMEKQELEERTLETKIITDFSTRQGVPCTEVSGFQNILDASHKNTQFNDYKSPNPIPSIQLIERVVTVDYPPFQNYSVAVQQAMENLKKLGKDSGPVGIATALEPIRRGVEHEQEYLITTIGKKRYEFIDTLITKETPEAIIEIIRSYFLIPLQRINTGYNSEQQLITPKQYKKGKGAFSEEHIKELDKIILGHVDYLDTTLKDDLLANVKLDYYNEQVTSMLKYASELRISRLQYDTSITKEQLVLFLKEILRITIFGPLYNLLNTEFIPETEEEIEDMNTDMVHTEFARVVKLLVEKYYKERIIYNPEQVREQIARAREIEKQGIIKRRFDSKATDERQIELIKKRLGLGDWSIGGTKLVYSYDADQWDKNRTDNLDNIRLLNDGGDGTQEGEGGYDVYDGPGNDED